MVSHRELEEWRCWIWKPLSLYLLLCAQKSGSSVSTDWRTKPEGMGGYSKSGIAVREAMLKWKDSEESLLSNWHERTEQHSPHRQICCSHHMICPRNKPKRSSRLEAIHTHVLSGPWLLFVYFNKRKFRMYTMEWKQKQPKFVGNTKSNIERKSIA